MNREPSQSLSASNIQRSEDLCQELRAGLPNLKADELRAILERCFPAIPIRSIRMIPKGWDNHVLEVNHQWIFRFPRRKNGIARVRMEMKLLPLVASISSIKVPEIEYVWPGGEGYGKVFLGYKKIPGVPMTSELLAQGNPTRVARQLSKFLREMHRIPLHRLYRVGLFEWRNRSKVFGDLKRGVMPLLNTRSKRRLASLFEEFLKNKTNLKFTPSLIHSDLTGGNILCTPGGNRITGVIDWGDASIGDAAYDFSGFLYEYGESFVDEILSEYCAADEGAFRRRMIFYSSILPFNVILGAKLTRHRFDLEEEELVVYEGDKRIHLNLFEYSKALRITSADTQ